MPDVEKTSVFGTAVHAVVGRGGVGASILQERLERAGLTVTSIAPVQPSLEDVFLELVEQQAKWSIS